jgi:hypothetical protein
MNKDEKKANNLINEEKNNKDSLPSSISPSTPTDIINEDIDNNNTDNSQLITSNNTDPEFKLIKSKKSKHKSPITPLPHIPQGSDRQIPLSTPYIPENSSITLEEEICIEWYKESDVLLWNKCTSNTGAGEGPGDGSGEGRFSIGIICICIYK